MAYWLIDAIYDSDEKAPELLLAMSSKQSTFSQFLGLSQTVYETNDHVP